MGRMIWAEKSRQLSWRRWGRALGAEALEASFTENICFIEGSSGVSDALLLPVWT